MSLGNQYQLSAQAEKNDAGTAGGTAVRDPADRIALETDEVTPELAKLVEMCSLFACSLDALVREDLAAGSKIYSDVTIRSLPPFRLAGYVMISPCPENDVNGYMDR